MKKASVRSRLVIVSVLNVLVAMVLATSPMPRITPEVSAQTSQAALEVMTIIPAMNVYAGGATIRGNLVSMGSAAAVRVLFEYGIDTRYGSLTQTQELKAAGPFTATLTGLAANTTYHYGAKAVSSSGQALGNDGAFTTPAPIDFPLVSPQNCPG